MKQTNQRFQSDGLKFGFSYVYSINIFLNKNTTHSLVIKAIYTPSDCYLRSLKIIFLMNNRYRLNILLGISQHLITTGRVSVELACQWGLRSCVFGYTRLKLGNVGPNVVKGGWQLTPSTSLLYPFNSTFARFLRVSVTGKQDPRRLYFL